MSPSDREIKLAQEYKSLAESRRGSFSAKTETAISKAFQKATIFDIETGGLTPDTPIYEMGFQHGIDNPTYKHYFVKPTDIKGTGPGEITQFTKDLLEDRQKTSPTILSDIDSATLSQKEAARTAYSELAGRDVWVQNLNFESRSLGERVGKRGFASWAQSAGLESYTNSGRLFTTTPSIKALEAEANAARGAKTPLDTYLSKWRSVFGELDKTLLGPRADNVTRVFDTQTLTKSVFAMAQQQGLMPKTGELFAGTAINTLSKAAFGIVEPHSALGDSALQGELTRFLYGTGRTLYHGEELSAGQKQFFERIGEVQEVQKQRGAAKNILNSFRQQQSYLASIEEGAPNKSLIKDFRTDFNTEMYDSNLKVRNPDGSYTNQKQTFFGRSNINPQYTTDIDELVSAWKVRDASSHGIKPDYDAALKEVKREYINPYNEKLGEFGHDRRKTLFAMEGKAEAIHGKIKQDVADTLAHGKPGWLKKNWKIGAGAAAVIGLAGFMFSGKDDEYNYIEGLRHGGFAESSRKEFSDFGSGWNALRGLVRAGETFEEMISSKAFQTALSDSKVLRRDYTNWQGVTEVVDDVLGKGEFGEAVVRRGVFRDQEFNFVRKTGRIGEHEVEALKAMEGLNAPTYYGGSVSGAKDLDNARMGYMDIEYFPQLASGKAARSAASLERSHLNETISALHERGYIHGDLHGNNLVWTEGKDGEGVFGVIDWGLAKPTSPGDPRIKDDLRRAKGTFIERMRPYVDSFSPEGHKEFRTTRRKRLERLKQTSEWATMSDEAKMKALGIDPARQEVVIRKKVEDRRRVNRRINPIDGWSEKGIAGATRPHNTDFGSPWQGLKPSYKDSQYRSSYGGYANSKYASLSVRYRNLKPGTGNYASSIYTTEWENVGTGHLGKTKTDVWRSRADGRMRMKDGAPAVRDPSKSYTSWKNRTTAERQKSNIIPHTSEILEKEAVNIKRPKATKTKAIKRIKSARDYGGSLISLALGFGVAGAFWAMSGSSGSKDFGSPWQGLNTNPDEDKRVAKLKIKDYYVEDADTVRIMLEGGNEATLRLAGIDAPEVEHGDNYASNKIFQNQPFGKEATEILEQLLEAQDELYAVFDPEGGSTYGRTPALLFGDDNVNLNLELVRKGAAAALPFGKAKDRLIDAREFKRAQEEAFDNELGMWSDPGWRLVHDLQSGAKKKITHNTFTSLERLFGDFRAASIVQRLRNPDAAFSQMQAAGGRDDFNIIEGLRHGWAQANREANTGDFGSGYRIDKVINTMKLNTRLKKELQRGQRVANSHVKNMMNPKNWTQHHKGN